MPDGQRPMQPAGLLHFFQPPPRRLPRLDLQPRKGRSRRARRAGDATGIQPAHAGFIDFVAHHVRVAVQHELHVQGPHRRRNMGEEETMPFALQAALQRPERVILVVAEHHVDRPAQGEQRIEDRRFAYVAQVPDLVRLRHPLRQARRQKIVGVGDDGDAHHFPTIDAASGTYGSSCNCFTRRPASNCHQMRAFAATTSSTSTRKMAITAASIWLFRICVRHTASSAGVPPAATFSFKPRAMARNPIGAGLKSFIQPADMVTARSQASGAAVTQAYRLRPILINTVVPKLTAITARSWLATPKIGQSELMPPNGSTTPW